MQEKAAVLLAAGVTQESTAQAVGRRRSTICRWLEDEEFRAAVRRVMEQNRHAVESRVFSLASESAHLIQKWLRSESFQRQALGAKLSMTTASRFAARYKDVHVEGYVAPPAPIVVFPPGTRMPWTSPELPAVDVNAEVVGASEAEAE